MSFTYEDPSNSDSDAVRFSLGDTIQNDALFTDEEIAYSLAETSNVVRLAAALCADSAVAKYARQPTSKTLGETSITFGNLTQKFRELADHLRSQHRLDAFPVPVLAADLGGSVTPIAQPLTAVPEAGSGTGTS